MRRFPISVALLASLIAVAAAPPAFAQMIHGRLLQDGTLAPLSGASVQLMDPEGNELDRVVVTNASGTFAMRVSPGRYTLRIRRIGFNPLTTPVISLAGNEVFEGTYRVTPAAVRLATERITEKRNLEPGRDGFFRRKALGKGVFLARSELAEKDQREFALLLRDVEGLRVEANGKVVSLEGGRCLYFVVNDVPVSSVPGGVPGSSRWPTLEDLVPTGHDVMGIEVYREFSEVPPELRIDAWPTARRNQRAVPTTASIGRRGLQGPCGLVSVWTRVAW